MPNLDEKSVIKLAEEYIKKYKLHRGFPEYKFQCVLFLPSPSLYSDEPIWEVVYDAEGWDDLQHSIIISDTEQIALCISGFQPIWLPKDFQEKEEKQIAELLRVSVNTVKTQKQRAKAYLKGRLGELFVYMTLFFFEF